MDTFWGIKNFVSTKCKNNGNAVFCSVRKLNIFRDNNTVCPE